MLTRKIAMIAIALLIVSILFMIPMRISLAAGQPNQSCEVSLVRPGNSMSAPGSAFNPEGVSGGVYAGTQSNNTINSHTFSQYDVACYQLAQH